MITVKETHMSRSSKLLAITIVVVCLLACNFLTQPFGGGNKPTEAPQPAGKNTPSVSTDEDSAANTPNAEDIDTPSAEDIEHVDDMLNPQGTPLKTWKDIPVMPQATAGQEFAKDNTYSFKVKADVEEVYDFYKEKLTALGWDEPYPKPIQGDSANIVFVKGNRTLSVTVVFFKDQGFTVVWLISI
jgi:hypothetical protein